MCQNRGPRACRNRDATMCHSRSARVFPNLSASPSPTQPVGTCQTRSAGTSRTSSVTSYQNKTAGRSTRKLQRGLASQFPRGSAMVDLQEDIYQEQAAVEPIQALEVLGELNLKLIMMLKS